MYRMTVSTYDSDNRIDTVNTVIERADIFMLRVIAAQLLADGMTATIEVLAPTANNGNDQIAALLADPRIANLAIENDCGHICYRAELADGYSVPNNCPCCLPYSSVQGDTLDELESELSTVGREQTYFARRADARMRDYYIETSDDDDDDDDAQSRRDADADRRDRNGRERD